MSFGIERAEAVVGRDVCSDAQEAKGTKRVPDDEDEDNEGAHKIQGRF